MTDFVNKLKRLHRWWLDSLYSCVPQRWAGYLGSGSRRYDLIIRHQDGAIVVMHGRGDVVDMIPLSGDNKIEFEKLAIEDSLSSRISSTQIEAVGGQALEREPVLPSASESLDIDLTDSSPQINEDSLDQLLEQDKSSNVVMLNRTIGDITLLLGNQDKTARLVDSNSDEDTMVLRSDQGNSLEFNRQKSSSEDGTLLFHSVDGKIMQVHADDSGANGVNGDTGSLMIDSLIDDGDRSEYVMVKKLLADHLGSKRGAYLLPDSRVLNLKLSYPVEAMQNIENVLRYDLENHIPLSEQEVRYFYALNIDSDRGKVEADVAVIKAAEFDMLNEVMGSFDHRNLLCTTNSFFERYGGRINFLEQPASSGLRRVFRVSSLHSGFNFLLLLALLAMPYLMFYQGIDSIEAVSVSEIQRVQSLISEFNSIKQEDRQSRSLMKRINARPKAIDMLELLSSRINQQAWLQRFNYSNNEIRISGEAVSATAVSDDLNDTGLFQSIKFVSSIVTNARTGRERFDLLLTLKSNE